MPFKECVPLQTPTLINECPYAGGIDNVFAGLGSEPFRLYLVSHGFKERNNCWEAHLRTYSKEEIRRLAELRNSINSERTSMNPDENVQSE